MQEFDRIAHERTSTGTRPNGHMRQMPLACGLETPIDDRAPTRTPPVGATSRGALPAATTVGMEYDVAPPAVLPNRPILAQNLPALARASGRIVGLVDLARDVVELTIAPAERIEIAPGQYCRFHFRGFPPRCFSPAAPLGILRDDGYLRLHVKRVRGGRVTSQIGRSIKAGHPVLIEGPLGPAMPRPAPAARMVLVSSGTGFAPIWSVAVAALREEAPRRIVLAGSAPTLDTFYMAPALELARTYPNVSIVAAVAELVEPWHGFLPGEPTRHLPSLSGTDVVYAAGSRALVRAVGAAAAAAGAQFHAMPFSPAAPSQEGWLGSARRWLTAR